MPSELYLIALLPPEELRAQVRELKQEMQQRFNSGHALKAPAHITLQAPFRMPPKEEKSLIKTLRRFASRSHSFTIELDGFDCFAPRVIFIGIKDPSPIKAMELELKKVLKKNCGLPTTAIHPKFHPHMTIATRDLTAQAFQQAWPEFSKRHFYGTFEVARLFLLKHKGSCWEIFREFEFGVAV